MEVEGKVGCKDTRSTKVKRKKKNRERQIKREARAECSNKTRNDENLGDK